jgi:hypothetical protein
MLTGKDLTSIVEAFDDGFQSASRRKRFCTAFKAATHNKHVQRFRESLNETKATLTLAMVHEWYVWEQYLVYTNRILTTKVSYNCPPIPSRQSI